VRARRLAEDVDPPGVRRAGFEHRPGDQVKVVPRVNVIGADVRAEERCLVGDFAGEAQQPGLVLDGEPVPALDLDSGGALGAHLRDPGSEQCPELIVGCLAGRGNGPRDAAAVVAGPRHAGGEFVGAIAREYEVRMRVHERRDDGPAGGIDAPVGRRRRRGRTDPGDPVAFDDQRGVSQDPQPVADVRAVRDELADPVDQDTRHESAHRSSIASASSPATSPSR
jgi:hypothetical protein